MTDGPIGVHSCFVGYGGWVSQLTGLDGFGHMPLSHTHSADSDRSTSCRSPLNALNITISNRFGAPSARSKRPNLRIHPSIHTPMPCPLLRFVERTPTARLAARASLSLHPPAPALARLPLLAPYPERICIRPRATIRAPFPCNRVDWGAVGGLRIDRMALVWLESVGTLVA